MHVTGKIHYDLVAGRRVGDHRRGRRTVALWFTVSVHGWCPITGAAAIMAVAVCGMHYTGMAAMKVELDPGVTGPVSGIRPLLMIVPITLITAATLLGVALSALQAMTEEEFTDGAGDPTPRRARRARRGRCGRRR